MAVNLNSSILPEGLTFCVDANNPKSWSPNVHPYPLDMYTWTQPGGAYQMTLSRDTTMQSPVGNAPMKMVTSGTSGYTGTYNSSTWNLAPAASGQTWTVSFWIKASSAVTASMLIFEANSAGNYITYGQPSFSVTTDWTRVSGTYTFTNASTAFIQARIDCYVNGVTLWVDGIQVEQRNTTSRFNSMSNPTRRWYDISGNSINLTYAGTVNHTAKGGIDCFGFNSSMYWYSSTSDAQKTDYRYGTSIEMWLYNETKPTRRTVFEKGGNSYQSYEQEIAMTWETGNDISGYRNYNGYDYSGSGALNNNAWNHVVCVLRPHLTTGQWYINGSASGSWTQRAIQLPPQANDIRIGNGYAGICDTGGVAVVRTYRTIFDNEDVLNLYNYQRREYGI